MKNITTFKLSNKYSSNIQNSLFRIRRCFSYTTLIYLCQYFFEIFIKISKIYIYKQKNWQLPIFALTIVGVKVLNFCVRDGNRCIHFAIVTNLL